MSSKKEDLFPGVEKSQLTMKDVMERISDTTGFERVEEEGATEEG